MTVIVTVEPWIVCYYCVAMHAVDDLVSSSSYVSLQSNQTFSGTFVTFLFVRFCLVCEFVLLTPRPLVLL